MPTNKQRDGKRKAEESARDEGPLDAEGGFHKRFRALMEEWPEEMSKLFSPQVSEDQRSSLLDLIGEQGEELKGEFAWAIPDERAIRILKHLSPIVEVGAGKGYWASLLKKAGGDILAYDAAAESSGKGSTREKRGASSSSKADDEPAPWTKVLPGGPEVLGLPSCKGRALLLCYPDEYELSETSLGEACLDEFQGDTVIHVGEVFGDTISLSQAPWGRTSGPDFLCRLSTEFHCILKAALPSWPISRDTISVWKRTVVTTVQYDGQEEEDGEEGAGKGKGKQGKHIGREAEDAEEEDIGDSEDEEDEEEDDEGEDEAGEGTWAHIPADERLSLDVAAPCVAHLLLP